MTDFDIGWLAGIVDGEGTITLSPTHRYDRKHISYSATIQISTTSTQVAHKAIYLLKDMGLDPALCIVNREKEGYKEAYLVRLTNKYEIERCIHTIKNHLSGKQEQAFWMIEFFKQRELDGKYLSQLSHNIASKIAALNKRNVRKGDVRGES